MKQSSHVFAEVLKLGEVGRDLSTGRRTGSLCRTTVHPALMVLWSFLVKGSLWTIIPEKHTTLLEILNKHEEGPPAKS